VVKEAWRKPLLATDAVRRLHIKLSRTVKALRSWERTKIGNIKTQLAVAKEVIWQIDQAQERRNLADGELEFRAKIKETYLGLIAIEKMRARQRSRLTNIRYGDASTKYFFLRANGRWRKKHIQFLWTTSGLAIKHEDKENEISCHFEELLGTKQTRTISLNWEELDYPSFNLEDLDLPISEEEIKGAVASMPKENAPGPDGFIGAFYSKCWETLKGDVVAAVLQLSQLRGDTFNLFNTANIVLLSKKEQVERVGDYKPISLMHSVAKIFSKILANRLGPQIPEMVSSAQCAFVKKCCIHDNYILVQGIIKSLSSKKTPAMFLKLDIAKAFDSISWAYHLELLQRLEFGSNWKNWISIALSTSSSRILLNGTPSKPIKYGRGLRQGDPISPMLFILAMDPLQKILLKASERGLLQPLCPRGARIKASLYAHTATIFVKPTSNDIASLNSILDILGQASGLKTNLQKSENFPIACNDINLGAILEGVPVAVKEFPC
jgi:hypothetical protein